MNIGSYNIENKESEMGSITNYDPNNRFTNLYSKGLGQESTISNYIGRP